MELTGWTKNWRKKWVNPTLRGRTNHLVVFDWIISHAVFEGQDQGTRVRFAGKIMTLTPGQLTCGAIQISRETGVSRSTVGRIIRELTSERLIEQRTDHQCSLLTVTNWELYQGNGQGTEQRTSIERATSEQRVSTKEEEKKLRSKEAYVVRPETKALNETIDELCQKYGLRNAVNLKALDVLVERYVGRIHMKVEVQHCVAWLVSKGLTSINDRRIGNWFKKAQEIQKRDQLKQLEWKEAQVNPAMAQRRKELKGKQEGFDLDRSVQDFAQSQT